ncbi:unnamed protein product, partial [Ceratitis capitata]
KKHKIKKKSADGAASRKKLASGAKKKQCEKSKAKDVKRTGSIKAEAAKTRLTATKPMAPKQNQPPPTHKSNSSQKTSRQKDFL